MVTVICFLNDVGKALSEAYRVLKSGGCIVIAFIDKNSPIGSCMSSARMRMCFTRRPHFTL